MKMRRLTRPCSASTKRLMSVAMLSLLLPSRLHRPTPCVSALEICPALGRHELRPALVELPMVALAKAVVAGPGLEVLVVALMAQPHLHIQRIAPGDDPAAGAGTLLPVVHVILLKGARRAEAPHPSQPHGLLDLGRGRFIHIDPGPELDLVGSPWVPDAERARGRAEERKVGKHRADDGINHTVSETQARLHLQADGLLVGQDGGHRRIRDGFGVYREWH